MAQTPLEGVGSRSYRISVEEETIILAGAGAVEEVAPLLADGDAAIIHEPVDPVSTVAEKLVAALEDSNRRVLGLRACGGEGCKSVEWILNTWKWLAKIGASRATTLFIIGGGALLDAGGFAAATYMRGVPTVLIPTTTLSAFDAAAGGKTAINLEGKNVIGAFHNPKAIIVEPSLLLSLPERAFRSGFAETVKHALLSGPSAMKLFESLAVDAARKDPEALSQLALWSLDYKMSVVVRDPRERGLRRILNLGHTIGHVIEAASSYSLTHGEAVSIGLVAELEFAEGEVGLDASVTTWARRTLEALSLPTKLPDSLADEVLSTAKRLLLLDKKRAGSYIIMPLLKEPGKPVLERVSVNRLIEFMREVFA